MIVTQKVYDPAGETFVVFPRPHGFARAVRFVRDQGATIETAKEAIEASKAVDPVFGEVYRLPATVVTITA